MICLFGRKTKQNPAISQRPVGSACHIQVCGELRRAGSSSGQAFPHRPARHFGVNINHTNWNKRLNYSRKSPKDTTSQPLITARKWTKRGLTGRGTCDRSRSLFPKMALSWSGRWAVLWQSGGSRGVEAAAAPRGTQSLLGTAQASP